MRHQKRGRQLNVSPSHRKAMLRNMAIALIENESISTTDARAKEVRPFFEKIVTLGKRGDLHARRRALSLLPNKQAVAKIFTTISPRFADRDGGYTRIIKMGQRRGDSAPMSLIELVVKGNAGHKEEKSAKRATKPEKKVEDEDVAIVEEERQESV